MTEDNIYYCDDPLQEAVERLNRGSCSVERSYWKLVSYIDELIHSKLEMHHNAELYLDYKKLPFHIQCEISRLMIESEDREAYECFLNPSVNVYEDDVVSSLLMLLRDQSKSNKEDLINLIMNRACDAYAVQIQELINERVDHIIRNYLDDNNMECIRIDREDFVWRKRA